jgi:serine/threonine protein kinase/tetratricopeptide (TPR) repeat protein
MNQERLNLLENLYQEALALAPDQRAAFVELACGSDAALREVLQAWLAQAAPVAVAALTTAGVTTGSVAVALPTNAQPTAGSTADAAPARATNPQPPANVTRQLDQYRLLELLGSGAMGRVYLAEDTQLGKRVALKILPGSFAEDADRVARFQREARMLALAHHPNIAEAYLLRCESRPPYLVMEFVPGETLGQRVQRGALPLHEAVPLLRQMAAALEAAHARQVIHRDLKPDNIKLTPDGTLKLLDFGLAKQVRNELTTRADAEPRAEVFSTQRHVIAGTVPYMSPEQTRGEVLDARSDLWAFGCVAFEMLTGQRPFAGLATHEVLQAIRTHEPDWSLLPAAMPATLRQLLQAALRKKREERLASATDAIKALNTTSATLAQRARWRHWRKYALAAALVLLAVSAIAFRQPLLNWFKTKAPTVAVAPQMPREKRLLILPFTEKGAPTGWGKQLAVALQTRLRDVPGLQVMPYAEKLRLPARSAVTAESLRPLGVNLLLAGELEPQGEKLAVRYWLDNAQGQRLVALKTILTTADLRAAQTELAASVVDSLQAQQPAPRAEANWQDAAQRAAYYDALVSLQDDLPVESLRTVITQLEKLRTDAPQVAPLLVTLAEAQLRLAKETNDHSLFRAAQQLTEQALQLDANDLDARRARGRLRLLLGDTAAAESDLQEVLRQRPSDIESTQQLGEAYFAQSKWEQSEQAFKSVTNYWPGYWRGYNDLGAFYFDRGKLPAALENWQQVTALHPASGNGYVNVGTAYVQMGKFAEAIAAYEQALRNTFEGQSSALEAYVGLSAAHYYVKAYDQAARVCADGLAAYPNNPTLHGNHGDALRYLTGQEVAATEAYTKAIKLLERARQTAEGLATLAEYYAKRSKLSNNANNADRVTAQRYLQRALRSADANTLEVQQRALLVASLLGDTSSAFEHLKSALQLGLDPATLNAEPDLDSMRLDPRYAILIRQNK